jgi:outer membrane protein assembly factor BamB
MTPRLLVLAAVSVFGAGAAAGADAWPEFRGPTGQGHATAKNLPLEWGKDKNIAWQQAIPGAGWSSPVVAAGRVYLTTAVPGDTGNRQSLRALCLDAATGKILWDHEVFSQDATAPHIHAKNSHASPTPLVHDQRLYVHFGHQGTACLDLDGKVLWRNREHGYEPVHGNGGTPIVVDDALIFSCDGDDQRYVVALDRNTGKQRWKTDRPGNPVKGFSFHTPLLITVKEKKQVVSAGSDAVCAYDSATGKEIWKVRYTGYSVIPRPVFGHGLVFVTTGFDSPTLLAIRPDGEGDVTATHVAWRARRGVPLTPSLLLVGDELYMVSDSGTASCLDARTGKEHWQRRIGTAFSASPLFADGRIYFQSEDGVGTILKAGLPFGQLARNDLGERTLASYAAIDGALFIRTEKHLYRIQTGGR